MLAFPVPGDLRIECVNGPDGNVTEDSVKLPDSWDAAQGKTSCLTPVGLDPGRYDQHLVLGQGAFALLGNTRIAEKQGVVSERLIRCIQDETFARSSCFHRNEKEDCGSAAFQTVHFWHFPVYQDRKKKVLDFCFNASRQLAGNPLPSSLKIHLTGVTQFFLSDRKFAIHLLRMNPLGRIGMIQPFHCERKQFIIIQNVHEFHILLGRQ